MRSETNGAWVGPVIGERAMAPAIPAVSYPPSARHALLRSARAPSPSRGEGKMIFQSAFCFGGEAFVEAGEVDHHAFVRALPDQFHLISGAYFEFDAAAV